MPYYRSVGEIPRKRHLRVQQADGAGLYFEELMGANGFAQESALLYHRHSPSAIVAADPVDCDAPRFTPNVPLLPRHLRTGALAGGGDPVLDRHYLLGNSDVRLAYIRADRSSGIYRNAVGDELVYVQSGQATLETSFGVLALELGDYVVIPCGTTCRWELGGGELGALVVEAAGHINFPARYLSTRGQLLEGAPFSERDLRSPAAPLLVEGTDIPVLVRTRDGLTRHVHARHPFDVAGWDGCLYPFALSIDDFEPIVGAIHQPPPVHQTFAGPNFVVCSFVPRPFDFFPGAIKIPYHHANVDSDEVLFYSAGDFMSRAGAGIGAGSISLHPAGFVHGPQPGSMERSAEATRTEEVAVMLDTFAPLGLSDEARAVSDPDYPWTWTQPTPKQ
jgi:homogentisate 1,2-dioxygenase